MILIVFLDFKFWLFFDWLEFVCGCYFFFLVCNFNVICKVFFFMVGYFFVCFEVLEIFWEGILLLWKLYFDFSICKLGERLGMA